MQKIRRILRLSLLTGLVLTISTAASVNIYAKDSKKDSYKEKEVPVYKNGPTDETITIRYYKETPNVPYIGIKEYYDCITKETLDEHDRPMSVTKEDDDIYILKSSHGEAAVDVRKDVMVSDDYSAFTNIMCLVQEGMNNGYVDGIPYVRVTDTTITGDGSIEFDFANYNINIYGDDEDVYFPAATLSDLFTDLAYHYSVFNGEKFYFNTNDSCLKDNIADIDPDYAKPIMDMLDEDMNRPADLADYSYNSLRFSLEHFYGFPGMAPLNDEVKEKGLEQALIDFGTPGEKTIELLKSRNFAEYLCGLDKLALFLNDGGHSAINYGKLGNAEDEKLTEEKDKINEDLKSLFNNLQEESDENNIKDRYYWARKQMRDNAYQNEKYIKKGDTAVFVLDNFMSFDVAKWDKYYKEGGEKPTVLTMRDDDMLMFHECINEAERDPDIKNFVIDCSNNLGGSLDEVAMLYCLVTGEREYTFHYENSLTGQKISETYEADTNFDGEFDEDDERDPYDLKIAVLTSSISFSCGNIFPSIMKDAGYPIMGEKSGGGACAVMVDTTGEGMTYRISAYNGRFINKAGEIIDNGVDVDVDLIPKRLNGKPKFATVKNILWHDEVYEDRCPDYSDFYDIEKLSEIINDL